ARPRNETTRLSALATGLRLMITAAPNTSISSAKIQKRNGAIVTIRIWPSLLFVPFQDDTVHHSADLEEFVFMVHHVFASKAGDGIIFSQINRLLRANFFAHPAVDAAHHVDVEFVRELFDLGETIAA